MALVVEDGTGLETANGYVEIAFVDSYFSAIGDTVWAALSETEKEQAIISATAYADLRWGKYLRGIPEFTIQALEFPRRRLRDRYGRWLEGVPTDWKKAICEYAKTAASQSLFPAIPSTAQQVERKRITVGPITTETNYKESGGVEGDYRPYPTADQLARKFTNAGLGVQVVR